MACWWLVWALWNFCNAKHTFPKLNWNAVEMCFYVTLEFLIYWDLFSVFVGIKTCPCWIRLQMRSVSNRNTKNWSFHVVVLARAAKKFTKNYNARAQLFVCSLHLLFGDVLVAVAVVFCVRSLIISCQYWRDPFLSVICRLVQYLLDMKAKFLPPAN